MGLYLCVFDDEENELDGLEMGTYSDYNHFLDVVTELVEKGEKGSVCPTLTLHHDSDGVWEPGECKLLESELNVIETQFKKALPQAFTKEWRSDIAKEIGLKPNNLYESFIDVNGDFIIGRLKELCDLAIDKNSPICFQ